MFRPPLANANSLNDKMTQLLHLLHKSAQPDKKPSRRIDRQKTKLLPGVKIYPPKMPKREKHLPLSPKEIASKSST